MRPPPVVLDASAAVRAVMDAAAQEALLQELAAAPLIVAPGLLRLEVANALWKYSRSGLLDAGETLARHAEAMNLVHRFIDEQSLFPEALQLAIDHAHPVYDALYAVSARRHAATLVTFDHRLHALCRAAGVSSRCFAA